MSEALLIFTFSPVQSFIAEARRTGDLYAGSRILAELAAAAACSIGHQGGKVVYPQSADGGDMPNKLVALVPQASAASIGRQAEAAVHDRWRGLAAEGLDGLVHLGATRPDGTWQAIWERQTAPGYLWQCFWAAAELGDGGYAEAYRRASATVDAVKHSRLFPQAVEQGEKDSLSGKREALHLENQSGRRYWREVAGLPTVTGALLRKDGRERLDAIGVVKRFGNLYSDRKFPSVSSIAAAPFLAAARPRLSPYRDAVERLLGETLYRVSDDAIWPYDGDLLFEDTLTRQRLFASYGAMVDPDELRAARAALNNLYEVMHSKKVAPPCPYYAVIKLDGDDMGERISACLREKEAEAAHRRFSQSLAAFSSRVAQVTKGHRACRVYNGGDDVLALTPATAAIPFVSALAEEFRSHVGATASAGVALAHHLSPLDAALEAANEAERLAKGVPGKAAICVGLLRRSGEHVFVRSSQRALAEPLARVLQLFSSDVLSGRLAYEVCQAAYALPEPGPELTAELKRLLLRHSQGKVGQDLALQLNAWAESLPEPEPGLFGSRVEELGQWLVLARFLASQGGEDAT